MRQRGRQPQPSERDRGHAPLPPLLQGQGVCPDPAPGRLSISQVRFICSSEVGIYKRKILRKKVRIHAFDQEKK